MASHIFGILRKNSLFLSLTTLALFLSFSLNIFGAMAVPSFLQNFKDSEALVSNEIMCKGAVYGGQMLESKTAGRLTQDRCDPVALKPYSSQFGLQGRVYSLAYSAVSSKVKYHAFTAFATLATALLSAICFGLLVLWVRQRYGFVAAVTFTSLVAISPMVVGFARNLYWALPLMVGPFIYALYLFDQRRRLQSNLLFWAGLFVLFMVRYLCGYEYLTTLTIMVMAAAAYHLTIAKSTWQTFAKQFSLVLATSVMAFVAALGIHVISLSSTVGSTSRAISIVKARAFERTANTDAYLQYPIMGLKANLPDAYSIANTYLGLDYRVQEHSRAWAFIAAGINYSLLPVINLPVALGQPFATFAQSLTAFIALLWLVYRKRDKFFAASDINDVKALYIGAGVGLIGFLSWLVMAPSHSLVHAHINGILIYLPFALFGYMVIGLGVQHLITRIQRLRGTPA